MECNIIPITNITGKISPASITGTTSSVIQRGIIKFDNYGIQGVENSITPIEINCIRNEIPGAVSSYQEKKDITIYSQSCMDGQKTSKIGNNIIGCQTCPKTEYLKFVEAKNAVLVQKVLFATEVIIFMLRKIGGNQVLIRKIIVIACFLFPIKTFNMINV